MTATLSDTWADMPASGSDAYLAQKGASQDSYRAWRLGRNANYLMAARTPQVLASGNHNQDYGTYASVTCDTWAVQTSNADYYLRHRGRAILWPPHDFVDIKLMFKAAAAGSDGSVILYVSDEPLMTDLSGAIPGRARSDTETVYVGASFSSAYSISIEDCPVGADGMIYFYVGLKDIDKWGSWCVFREAISG